MYVSLQLHVNLFLFNILLPFLPSKKKKKKKIIIINQIFLKKKKNVETNGSNREMEKEKRRNRYLQNDQFTEKLQQVEREARTTARSRLKSPRINIRRVKALKMKRKTPEISKETCTLKVALR